MRRWICPVSILDEILTKFPDAEISTSILEEMERIKKLKNTASATSSSSVDLNINGNKLMPFQNAGVEFLDITKGKALIADEMGLGKTIQAIAYLYKHPELRPALIVCPASLKINWQREIQKWLNESAVIVNGKGMVGGKIFIINYDILKNYKDVILGINPQVMILDESHYIKNYKAQRTKLVTELAQKIPNRILLTGTPILNRPKELWTQLNIIDPKTYNNFFNFGVRYCAGEKTQYGWDFNGVSHQDELNEKLKTIMVRRTKAQVLSELPDKRRTTIDIPIDNRTAYNSAKDNFLSFISEWKGQKAADRASKAEVLTRIETLKQVAVEGKMDEIKEWIADFLESGEKLIIFAHHRSTINSLMVEFADRAVFLDGSVDMEGRQKVVDQFQNNPNIKLFIGNIKAAGVGITLTAASNVAFVELPWTPSELTQAEDRAHRIGQKNAVNVYYLVSEGTIEATMSKLLNKKAEIINSVIDGKDVKDFDIFNELMRGI